MIPMKRHKLGFGNRSIPQQLLICRRIADGIAKLPAASRSKVPRNDLGERTTKAQKACTEVEQLKLALKSAVERRNRLVRDAREAADFAARGLSALAGGDATAMHEAGLEVVRDRRSVGRPGAPSLFRSLPAEFEGSVKLRWKRPVRRCTFVVQASADAPPRTGWKHQLACVKQTCTVKDLKSGKQYSFRVAALNAHGQGPWSEVISVWVR